MAPPRSLALLLLPALATALPQASTSDIPPCAIPAVLGGLGDTGCTSLTDTQCVCSQPGLAESLTAAVVEACKDSPEPVSGTEVTDFIGTYCQGITPPGSSSAAPAPTTEAPTTEAPIPTATTPIIINNGTTIINNGTNNTTPTWSATPTPSNTTVPSTGGAAANSLSMAALVAALGGMSWIFAEL